MALLPSPQHPPRMLLVDVAGDITSHVNGAAPTNTHDNCRNMAPGEDSPSTDALLQETPQFNLIQSSNKRVYQSVYTNDFIYNLHNLTQIQHAITWRKLFSSSLVSGVVPLVHYTYSWCNKIRAIVLGFKDNKNNGVVGSG